MRIADGGFEFCPALALSARSALLALAFQRQHSRVVLFRSASAFASLWRLLSTLIWRGVQAFAHQRCDDARIGER